jgi:uncharacterized protein HemY
MTTKVLETWWQQYREVKYCNYLQNELLKLLHGQFDAAKRLIELEKTRHPGQLES